MLPRMRTTDQAYDYLKQLDPETAISRWGLRQMVLRGEIPCVKAGNRYLINLDTLEHYLSNGNGTDSAPKGAGKIRFVNF